MSLFWPVITLLQAIFVALWSAFWILAALWVRLATRDTTVSLAMARRFWAPGLLRFGGLKTEATGLENVDFSKAHVFAANHQSLLDTVVLFDALPVPLLFVVKEELRRVPLLGAYMSAMGMIFIRRRQRRRSIEAMELCGRRLAEGRSILIFPEGTRSPDGHVGPFKPGAFVPLIDAAAPIVPIAIEGTGRILPTGSLRVRPGPIRLAVGQPIATAGLDRQHRREVARQVREAVISLHQQIALD